MLNIEIINNKVAVIKMNDYKSNDILKYEIFGNNGYNINGNINVKNNIFPTICFEYNLTELYFIKIIKNDIISYNKFFNPNNKNLDTKLFINKIINNINMKIEKSFIETDNESPNESPNESSNDNVDESDDEDKPEIISLEDIENMT